MVMFPVEVQIAGVAADPCRIALPLSVTHGRSEIGVQCDPPTATVLWDGADCPWKIGDTVEISSGGGDIPAATYDDPVATYDDPVATYDDAGTVGGTVRRFLGEIAGLTAQGRLGVVTGWELECVGIVARLAYRRRKISRPAETDVARILGIAGVLGPFMQILGEPTVTLAAADLDGDMLSLWHEVCESSAGLLWQSAYGDLTYETADHRTTDSTPVGSIQCEVVDDEISWESAVEDIINEVTVSYGPSTATLEVTHQDDDSVAEQWGVRHADITTQLADEANATQLALLVLARRAFPFYGMTNGLVAVDALAPAELNRFHLLEIGTPVLIPIPVEPGPTPADPTPVIVEGWVETWGEDGHTAQMAFSDQKRWALTSLRDYETLRGQTYGYWRTGSYLNALVQEAA